MYCSILKQHHKTSENNCTGKIASLNVLGYGLCKLLTLPVYKVFYLDFRSVLDVSSETLRLSYSTEKPHTRVN